MFYKEVGFQGTRLKHAKVSALCIDSGISLSLLWGHSVHFAKFPILRFSKRYSFHWIPSKLYENIAYHRAMQAITLLDNRPSFTKFMALWNLSLEPMGNLMWNISKTADCRAKQILDRRANRKLWHMTFFLTQDHMQLEISRCYFSHNFHWSNPNFMTTLVTMINLNAS